MKRLWLVVVASTLLVNGSLWGEEAAASGEHEGSETGETTGEGYQEPTDPSRRQDFKAVSEKKGYDQNTQQETANEYKESQDSLRKQAAQDRGLLGRLIDKFSDWWTNSKRGSNIKNASDKLNKAVGVDSKLDIINNELEPAINRRIAAAKRAGDYEKIAELNGTLADARLLLGKDQIAELAKMKEAMGIDPDFGPDKEQSAKLAPLEKATLLNCIKAASFACDAHDFALADNSADVTAKEAQDTILATRRLFEDAMNQLNKLDAVKNTKAEDVADLLTDGLYTRGNWKEEESAKVTDALAQFKDIVSNIKKGVTDQGFNDGSADMVIALGELHKLENAISLTGDATGAVNVKVDFQPVYRPSSRPSRTGPTLTDVTSQLGKGGGKAGKPVQEKLFVDTLGDYIDQLNGGGNFVGKEDLINAIKDYQDALKLGSPRPKEVRELLIAERNVAKRNSNLLNAEDTLKKISEKLNTLNGEMGKPDSYKKRKLDELGAKYQKDLAEIDNNASLKEKAKINEKKALEKRLTKDKASINAMKPEAISKAIDEEEASWVEAKNNLTFFKEIRDMLKKSALANAGVSESAVSNL